MHKTVSEKETIRKKLKDLINFHGLENVSGTKDIILADYLLNCLAAFNQAALQRKMIEIE